MGHTSLHPRDDDQRSIRAATVDHHQFMIEIGGLIRSDAVDHLFDVPGFVQRRQDDGDEGALHAQTRIRPLCHATGADTSELKYWL